MTNFDHPGEVKQFLEPLPVLHAGELQSEDYMRRLAAIYGAFGFDVTVQSSGIIWGDYESPEENNPLLAVLDELFHRRYGFRNKAD